MEETEQIDNDYLEGCDLDFTEDPASDEDLDGIVLFGDGEDVEAKKSAWEELFHA